MYSRFQKWVNDGILDNIFRLLSLDAELSEISIDSTIVREHQVSAGVKKGRRSRGGFSAKIHVAVDALGNPIYLTLSQDQESDLMYAIDLLSHSRISVSNVLADGAMTVIKFWSIL